jgi:lambda repressor-like predicted transcriptional regulator
MSTTDIVHDWATSTLARKGWSARKWALDSGVAPSTLQRFINEKPWCLSQTVIVKLGSVSKSYPKFNDPTLLVSKVKTMSVMAFRKGALMETDKTIVTTADISAKAYAIPVQSSTMDQAGFNIGDTIVVDPDRKPTNGKTVLIQYKNKIQLMEYRTPYLLPRSSDQSQKEIDMGLVDIMGVVVQLIRNV